MADTGINIPEECLHIIGALNCRGFEAFVVGGCVRDALLGIGQKDWDITTDAKPGEIKSLFENTVDTGIKHGTVTVIINNKSFELTTYRVDGRYLDNRHPDKVRFTSSLEEDLSRRDFTINAIAYSPDKGFVDPFGGIEDIRNRIIRAVGEPDRRFSEDALRMMRAVRFSAEKGFTVDEKTLISIKHNSSLIKNISRERIRDELDKILLSEHPFKFILLRDTNLLQYILPEFELCFHTEQNNPYHIYNVGVHTLHATAAIERKRDLRWTMLLHDIGKPASKTTDEKGIDHFYGHQKKSVEIAESILTRLRFDKNSMGRVLRLIKFHDRDIDTSEKSVRKAVATVGEDIFYQLLKVKEADKRGQNPEYFDSGMEKLNKIKRIYNQIKEKGQCLSIQELAVSGDDLIDTGLKQGRRIGYILNRLMDMVIEDPSLNDKEKLLCIVRDKFLENKG
ncbi:MAG: CCA tRNA nucleotidyltransferase [Acetivibrionales bacterium]|jgi:tRNA nucleotidyltransferase (CCA-adding enzyme)